MPTALLEEGLLLPRDAIGKVTDHLCKSRYFLESKLGGRN
jgi:hypothetical protein